ncbi:helix-turn-helix transcriptional regulator [Citrobacter youngae]|uniref:helix-turn-helix transcriptional regulator n=1 Tax=Citrobacter youngae TaxID=133448 RepID=UPI0001C342DA|nr:LuxR C-terminal-related transcriptional regulator [Citrobacter youngae]
MATSILLVTQDYYLVKGMKIFFPEIIQLGSINRKIFDSGADEYSVLIDSRSPLRFYDYLIRDATKMRKSACCIMLDMRQREAQLLNLKLALNTSPKSINASPLFNFFINMRCERLTQIWLKNLELSTHEQIMLRLLRAGMTMDEVANKLNTSVKSLYRERTQLYERLGMANFNEACLFIFKNELLKYPRELPDRAESRK